MFLGTCRGITHFHPTPSIGVTFQAHQRSTRNSLSVCLCMKPEISFRVNLDLRLSQRWLDLAHGLGTWFVVSHGIVPWYCMWWSLYKAWGDSIVKWLRGERWLAHLAWMAGFGHVMKIFIGAGFPHMEFPGYIVCLSWMLLAMFIFSHIVIFYSSL